VKCVVMGAVVRTMRTVAVERQRQLLQDVFNEREGKGKQEEEELQYYCILESYQRTVTETLADIHRVLTGDGSLTSFSVCPLLPHYSACCHGVSTDDHPAIPPPPSPPSPLPSFCLHRPNFNNNNYCCNSSSLGSSNSHHHHRALPLCNTPCCHISTTTLFNSAGKEKEGNFDGGQINE